MRHLFFLLCLAAVGLLASPSAWSAPRALDRVQFGEGALAYSSGFIRQSLPVVGTISAITGDNQTDGNRRLLGKGDLIYLTPSKEDAVAVGDVLTVYRLVHEVFHPVDRSYMGNLFNIVGLVEVVDAQERPVTVKVLRAYTSVFPGDSAMKFEGLPRPAPRLPSDVFDGVGMIVDVPPSHTLIAQGHVVYIDRGSRDGLRPGDELMVFRKTQRLPKRTIGELKVLTVEPETAAALITTSRYAYLRGDRFELKRSAPALAREPESGDLAVAEVDEAEATDTPGATDTPEEVASVVDPGPVEGTPDAETRRLIEGLLDQVVFESGEIAIRPEGRKTLDRISEVLKEVTDKKVQIQGHTDNVPIGPSLKSTYPSNWELSQARAREVVRYLVEEAGVNAETVSAVGYGDSQPVASNASEEGRIKNRRVEILVLAPKPSEPAPEEAPAAPVESVPAPEEPVRSEFDQAIGELPSLEGDAVAPPPSDIPVEVLSGEAPPEPEALPVQ